MTLADDTTLVLKRIFEAPPEKVFDAWLTREEWQAWIGPEGVECEVSALQPHVGGGYRLEMRMHGGGRMAIAGIFQSIDRPRSLSFTWGAEGDPTRQSVITLTFKKLGDKTELTLRQEGLGNASNRDQHGEGWNSALNKFDRHLRQGRKLMGIRISAFSWVPPFAQGLVRDLRVRWALEEAGLDYEERLLRLGDNTSENYLHLQPFGQVPVYEENDLTLFESGAIVLHIAERCEILLPSDLTLRARATTWMFAALNTVEPPVMFLNQLQQMSSAETVSLQSPATDAVRRRLEGVANWLNGRDYLEAEFSAGDLLMATVLRILRTTDLVSAVPMLQAYLSRCEARPAFQRALAAQMRAFRNNEPADQPST